VNGYKLQFNSPAGCAGQQPSTQHGFPLGNWLAKHSVLLESLELHLTGAEQEAAVAAGLMTATQKYSSASAQPCTLKEASPATPAAAAQHPAGMASLWLALCRCMSPSTHGKQCDHGTLACAGEQLNQVSLKQLRVLDQWGCGHLSATAVQQLGMLTQLTSLLLQNLVLEVMPQQLAVQLRQLPALFQ
jgi:hypothetical protein